MKKLIFSMLLAGFSNVTLAQQSPDVVDMKKHHIVIQFNDGEAASQDAVVGQVKNILTAWPNAEVEVICHSSGLDLLTSAKSEVGKTLTELSAKGVIFSACNNSMRKRNVKKEDLVSVARVVPSAMIQLTLRQEEGWAYVKGGH
ncbi:MAG: DsrE family protein [Chryseolinea sp.]